MRKQHVDLVESEPGFVDQVFHYRRHRFDGVLENQASFHDGVDERTLRRCEAQVDARFALV